jgi:hypothetical protein
MPADKGRNPLGYGLGKRARLGLKAARGLYTWIPSDLIYRDFFALEPFKRFMEDITYLPCLDQTIYQNIIADYFNSEIPAYRFSEFVDARLCTATLRDL